ncbi:MAG TPA: TetR family transcriptional regulator [Steroidobacteraceae bacterium]|nr:TetR family transcriptional regulator [Steroidobacteraceae bacterium]
MPVRPSRKAAPRKRSASATKARILEAALSEFATRGFAGARVDVIAAQARANKRMLYAYVGNKDALWIATLEAVYSAKRREERQLATSTLSPEDAMRSLIRFNFRYHLEHPEFVALVNNENLMGARRLSRSKLVPQLYSPLLETLTDVLRRGQKAKVFRSGVDPMQLYISIAALGYFYISNIRTLSVIFASELASQANMKRREEHVIDVVMSYLGS